MSMKHYCANMQIAEKVAKGKSADISQNVRSSFRRNSRVLMSFEYSVNFE